MLALYQQATDELGGDDLGGAAEEALEEVLRGRYGYGSGLGDEVKHQYPPQSHFSVWFSLSPAPYHLRLPYPSAETLPFCSRSADAALHPSHLSLAGTAALALASLPLAIRPAVAQEAPAAAQDPEAPSTEAADLGVMGVNLRDAVKLNYGFQGALQGAGTPNQAGLGAFIPLHVGSNNVAFVDVLVNANFNDYGNYSSLINTTVAGTTFSTSTRLGYRWLNSNRSWMFGVNAGYDSRPMATGPADTGVTVTNSQTVFFQQVAASLEAVSNSWNFNAYALVPVGTTNSQLNSGYQGGSLDTYGLDAGYSITPDLRASVGYYYQDGDLNTADGSGVRGRLAYNLTNGLTVGANLSYDDAFETRVSADIKYRFGANGYGAPSIRKQQPVVKTIIQALSATPSNRDVRVHDPAIVETCVTVPATPTNPTYNSCTASYN